MQQVHDGWRAEIPLHQAFGQLVHLHLISSGYLTAVQDALAASLELLDS